MSAAGDDSAKAEAIKDEGNVLFKNGRFAEAVAKYNDAVELNPEVRATPLSQAVADVREKPIHADLC